MADEKFDEKAMEKREEKSPQEKSWDEKWRRDPLSTIVWAAILIWAGLALLAENLGFFDGLRATGAAQPSLAFLANLQTWSIIFVGAGVIVLFEVLLRLIIPDFRKPVGGTLIFGLILLGIGLGDIFTWNIIFPLILIGVGLSVILRGFTRPKE